MMPVAWGAEIKVLAARYGARTAVRDGAGEASFAAVFDHAAGVATFLREQNRAGRPVATYLRNGRAAVAASYGVLLAGGCEAPVNAALSVDDLHYCVGLADAGTVLTDADRVADLRDRGLDAVDVTALPPTPILALPEVPAPGDAWARITFTSGTTGRPKGVVHTQEARWTANLLLRANLPVAPGARTRILLMTPFAHGAALLTYAFLDGGGSVHLLDGVRLDAATAAIRNGDVDQIFAPPTVLAKLTAALAGSRVETIRTIYTGTAPLSPQLYGEARTIFGPVVRITYGKTEIFNPITVLAPDETDAWYADPDAGTGICVGWPASGVEVRIVPEAEGQGPPDGPAIGAVLLRARHMLAGLLIDGRFEPQDPAGFHRTGDLGFVDGEGRLRLVGRESDIIKTGGYSVSPEEVEALVGPLMPGLEFAVVGLPSSYWGEIVTLAVAGGPADWPEALSPRLAGLTAYKRPRLFASLDAIPRNAMGKLVRARLREAILARYAVNDGPYPGLLPAAGQASAD